MTKQEAVIKYIEDNYLQFRRLRHDVISDKLQLRMEKPTPDPFLKDGGNSAVHKSFPSGEDLGEDMQEYYARITRLAEELPTDKRCMLYLSFSAAMRKRRNYANEYRWIEEIVQTADCPEEIFSAAVNRLSEMNLYLDYSGNPDTEKLSAADSAVEAALAVEKGDFAYFGFDPGTTVRQKQHPNLRAEFFQSSSQHPLPQVLLQRRQDMQEVLRHSKQLSTLRMQMSLQWP